MKLLKNRFGVLASIATLSLLGFAACDNPTPPEPETGCPDGCNSNETCVYNQCVLSSKVCSNMLVCSDDQTCINGACIPNKDLCGNQLCTANQSCVNGQCVNKTSNECENVACDCIYECQCLPGYGCVDTKCIEGDHPKACGDGLVCSNGNCVTQSCVGVDCNEGAHCDNGNCVKDDPCAGIDCEEGTACLNGTCLDNECIIDGAAKECDAGLVCSKGNCVEDGCKNILCDPGLVCVNATCVDEACIGIFCDNGQTCRAGNCIDNDCLTVECPEGDTCRAGICISPDCLNVTCNQGKVCTTGGTCIFDTAPAIIASLENDDNTTDEDGKTAILNVSLNHEPAADVSISCAVSNDQEATANCALIFTPENWNVPQQAVITGVKDAMFDGDVEYEVMLTSSSEDAEFDALMHTQKFVNLDKTVLGVVVISESEYITSEDGTSVVLDVFLSAAPDSNVSFSIESSDPKEGRVDTDRIIFTPQNWSTPQQIVVTGVDDANKDGSQEYYVVFGNIESEDINYMDMAIDPILFVNQDNDVAGVTIPQKRITVNESGKSATIPVVLNTAPTSDVTVSIESSDDSEATIDIHTLTFNANNWNVKQFVIVSGVQDNIIDGDEEFNIIFTITSDDPDYTDINPVSVKGICQNSDKASLNVVKDGITTLTEESLDTASVQVSLSSIPEADVELSVISSDTSELIITSESPLVFTPETWNEPQTISVQAVDDFVMDGDQSASIMITANSADKNYKTLSSTIATYQVIDNDVAGIVLKGESTQIFEGSAETGSFMLSLSSQPTYNVTVKLTSSDSSELRIVQPEESAQEPGTASFTIKPADWNSPKEIKVAAVDDSEVDGDQQATINITLSSSDKNYNNMTAVSPVYIIKDKTE